MELETDSVPDSDQEDWLKRFRDDVPHVLLAEDDSDLRTLIATALRIDGFQVIEACNGRELMDRMADWLLYRWPFEELDLILSDVRMPGLTGTEIVSSLRRSRWNTPVILMTAYPDSALDLEARSLGVTSVFSKPFDIDDLRTAVLNVAGQQRWVKPPTDPKERYDEFDQIENEFIPRPPRERDRDR